MTAKVILFADNDPDFLEGRAEFLEEEGYLVLKALSPEDARYILDHKRVHLAVLDIRLTDDKDGDISGLELAQDPAYRSLPKIMLTGFPTVDDARTALRPLIGDLPTAVDYLSKKGGTNKDGPKELIEAVHRAFKEHVHINWDLAIQWDPHEHLSFLQLSSLAQPGLSNEALVQMAEEMEDLVRKLFYDYRHIRLGRLLWHDHRQFCLPVLMQSSEMTADLRILVCGDKQLLKMQQEQIERLAPNALQRTELHSRAETMHFGANLYELRGVDLEAVQTLRDLFQTGKERTFKTVFAHLLGDVLKAWHQHGQSIEETSDLMSVYRQWSGLRESDLSPLEVRQRVESLIQSVRTLEGVQIERNNDHLTFLLPGGHTTNYPDPVAVVYSVLSQYTEPVVCRISPGNLTADNVLVDRKLQTWLTDFAQAGQSPQWWDFICLEAAICFDLSRAPDFSAWQEFEECLAKPARLDESLEQSDVIPELRLSLAVIEQIRRQASVEAGADSTPYYAGLLAWTVAAMARYDPGVLFTQDRLRGAHLLLAACMIAQRLGIAIDSSLPSGRLRLDENGRVWLGERRVAALAGLRLRLLQCLMKHEGRAVNNQLITKEAYEEQYIADDKGQDQRIRQEIRRLREEIEPDPNRPRYIIAERGRGYRLDMSGEGEE